MSKHTTRYQGAIISNDRILLIRHQDHVSGNDYWLLPGGRLDDEESEEGCVTREMQEETHLNVRVERLLLDTRWNAEEGYNRAKTYLCIPVSGNARSGYEPEPEASSIYSIAEVRWFDLWNEGIWGEKVISDPITYPLLKRIQQALRDI